MSKRIVTTIVVFGALLLQTGCAVGATVTRPRLPTIVIGEVPPPAPEPAPLPPPPPPRVVHRPLPPPPPQPLTRGEAIAIGQRWCNANGYGCWLDDADFKSRQGVWRVAFDAKRFHGNGRGRGHAKHRDDTELRLDIDAWSGALLRVDARG